MLRLDGEIQLSGANKTAGYFRDYFIVLYRIHVHWWEVIVSLQLMALSDFGVNMLCAQKVYRTDGESDKQPENMIPT